MKAILPIILVSVLVGCASAPSPKVEAASHVRPIIAALQAYHRESGDYPQQLEGLLPHYLRADALFRNNTDAKHIWHFFYDRVDQNHYSLQFVTSPCSEAIYKNGKFIAAYGPAFN